MLDRELSECSFCLQQKNKDDATVAEQFQLNNRQMQEGLTVMRVSCSNKKNKKKRAGKQNTLSTFVCNCYSNPSAKSHQPQKLVLFKLKFIGMSVFSTDNIKALEVFALILLLLSLLLLLLLLLHCCVSVIFQPRRHQRHPYQYQYT